MSAAPITLDVVSLVYNRQGDCEQLLGSLAGQATPPDHVLLIDNGSAPPLAIDAGRYPFPVRIHRLDVNEGIAGYNHGFALSQAAVVVVVDSDVTLEPGALSRLKSAFAANADLVIAGARILDSATGRTMPDNPIHGADPLPGGGHAMVQFNGCCFGIRRLDFLSLGGFDKRLYLYVNEWDLTLRAFSRYRPEQIRYFPDAVARHKTSPSPDRSQLYHALVRRNELWVRWKYYPGAHALAYSARFILGSLRRILCAKAPGEAKTYARYLVSGLNGLGGWVLAERSPLPRSVFTRLMAMRDGSRPPDNVVSRH